MSSLNRKMRRQLGSKSKPKQVAQTNIISTEQYNAIYDDATKDYHNYMLPIIQETMKDLQQRVDKENLVIACKIVFEHYGQLKNKADRVRNFIDLHNAEMAEWEKLPIKDRLAKLDEEIKIMEERLGEQVQWCWKWSGGNDDEK